MKRIAIIVALASVFAACNNDEALVKGSRTEIDSVQIVKQSIKDIRDSLKLDSFERAEREQQVTEAQSAQAALYAPAPAKTQYITTSSVSRNYESQPVYRSEPAVQTRPAKKGWSSAAKGTAVGAGVGAVTGILVDKKDARGAIIGGVLGAGTGYVIGRAHDRKTGRVQK